MKRHAHRPAWCGWRRDQRGAATVLALALVLVLITVAVAAAGIGSIVITHRRAQAAADLAALAAARALGRGRGACDSAAAIAAENGARLDSCLIAGRDVTVEVAVTGAHLLGHTVRMRGSAKAGPAAGR